MTGRRPFGLKLAGAALIALAAAGCESTPGGPSEGLVGGDHPVSASHGVPHNESTFRMTGIGVLAGQDFAPGFGPPEFGRSLFEGRCSTASDFVIRFDLSGRASHLGSYTAELEHCVQVEFATGLVALTDGVATITAADGDELWDRYERLVPGGPGAPEHHRFIGGTGRFRGASGEGWAIPVCDRATGTCDFELDGVLIYDAADSAN